MRDHQERKPLNQQQSDSEDEIVIYDTKNHTNSSSRGNGWYTNIILTILAITGVVAVARYTIAAGTGGDAEEASNNAMSLLPEHMGLDLNMQPLTITQFSKSGSKPVLPGTYLINKVYNMMSGKQIYEQSGRDIVDFTFADSNGNRRYTQPISDSVYMIPYEFASMPNVISSCDLTAEVNDVQYSTSTSVLREQAQRFSIGAEWKFDVSNTNKQSGKSTVTGQDAEGKDNGVETESGGESETKVSNEIRFGFHFGHSSASSMGRSEAKSGFTYSFSSFATNTFYRAEIDWNGYNGFVWKQDFISDIASLNNDASNKAILSFFNKWGTHVLSKMQTGSFCTETVYASQESTFEDVSSFRKNAWDASVEVFNIKMEAGGSSSRTKTGTSSNGVSYQKSDVECHGEVKNTNNNCAGLASTTYNPVVTKSELLPIWQINGLNFTEEAVSNITSFYSQVLATLEDCKNTLCQGMC